MVETDTNYLKCQFLAQLSHCSDNESQQDALFLKFIW